MDRKKKKKKSPFSLRTAQKIANIKATGSVKNRDFHVRLPFQSWLCQLRSEASQLTPLSFRFLICKIENIYLIEV